MLKFLLVALAIVSFAQSGLSQCDSTQNEVRLEIDPDEYWFEVSWQITGLDGSPVYAEDTCSGDDAQTFEYCIPAGICAVFRIRDAYGDGMEPDGYYRLYVNDVLIHENLGGNYGAGESVSFDCPPGSYCTNPWQASTGQNTTPGDADSWYSFIPQDTGIYVISTCDFGLSCPTKIWVYDRCEGITVMDNNLGASFYADGGCPGGAEATLYLAGGKEYFIRVGYAAGACGDSAIIFNLQYTGPITGCTDSLACNYQPLATVIDTCIYPGDPECTDLPDLVIQEGLLRNSLATDVLLSTDACAVAEGCVRGFGTRVILRFATYIKNTGVADFFIGEAPFSPDSLSDQFVWDPCHFHWHYRGYAEYLLFDTAGTRIPIGTKNGFCILDTECSGGGQGKYTCFNMGISAGCGDIYDITLPCQWIDITGLDAGFYTLVVRVNWDKSPDKTGRPEISYDNNWAQACFELDYDEFGTPAFDLVNDCPLYTDCTGEVFGPAQPDCHGICNGPALMGDWNQDTLRDQSDVNAYLDAVQDGSGDATSCTDLELNDTIDVYDAALLQECVLHADDIPYWGTRFPCQFPGGIPNPNDIVYLLPGTLDTTAKTFEVRIANPFSSLIGFEFNVSGLTIDSVENLDTTLQAVWRFNAATGKILALSGNENGLQKNALPAAFLRIHYGALTAPQVCISAIQAIVNHKYQRCRALLADPNCVPTGISGIPAINRPGYAAFVVPNPAGDRFTVFFENPGNAPILFLLYDPSGRPVRAFDGLHTGSVTVERNGLPAGVYTYFIRGQYGQGIGKVVLK